MTLYEELIKVLDEQTEDDELWLPATTPTEVKFQDALRRLHKAVEFLNDSVKHLGQDNAVQK